MKASFYIWKWADNNVPAKPAKVLARLRSRKLHRAVQPFDARLIVRRLRKFAARHRRLARGVTIISRPHSAKRALFVRVAASTLDSEKLGVSLLWVVWKLKLGLYDESNKRLLSLPKRNVVEMDRGHQMVDIKMGDIPSVLRKLNYQKGAAWLAFYDREGNMFQVWEYKLRYAVEWQILPDRDFRKHRIWVAGKSPTRQKLVRLGEPSWCRKVFEHEVLRFADVKKLWACFFQTVQRPTDYTWRDITKNLRKPTSPPRVRHET